MSNPPFSDKHEAVLNALKAENMLAAEAVDAATIAEINARRDHLLGFFVSGRVPVSSREAWQAEDARLETAYAECKRHLNEKDQLLLRDAERAWIIYRDADAIACGAMVPDAVRPGVEHAARVRLTKDRVAQLKVITPTNSPTTVLQELPVENNFSTPEDTKQVGQLKEEARVLLRTFLEKRDAPFFTKAETMKHLPEIPPDVADEIIAMSAKFETLSHRKDSERLFESALNEYLAVELLSTWSYFNRKLKTGEVASAASAMSSILERKPKAVNADYAVLWQTAESWKPIYVRAVADYQDHVKKAKSLAQLGKNSDAIREYEAALAIIDNSSIPAEIKKLREQSLGL